MKRNKRKHFIETVGSILCIAALLAGTMSPAGQTVRVQAADVVDYTEQETVDNKNDSIWGTPERIQVNQLCAGTVEGEFPDGITDYEDVYQVEIDSDDFTADKRGRFRVELSTADGSNKSLELKVSSESIGTDCFYDARSQSIQTPSYSIAGPILISISSRGSVPVNYHLKVVYDTLEGNWVETERNTRKGNATQIQVNQDYWGCLHEYTYTEPAWYKYTLDEPGKVSISLKPQDGKKPQKEDLWRIWIYADPEDPDTYDDLDSGSLAVGVQSEVYSLPQGTYYICIWGNNEESSVGQVYELRVDYEADSEQIPEETATAVPTEIPEGTATAVPTATPTAEATATPTPEAIATATPTATPTAMPEGTTTATPTATPTPEAIATATPTAIPTEMPEGTATAVPTATSTAAPTASPAETPGTNPPVTTVTNTTEEEERHRTVQNEIKTIRTTRVINVTLKVSPKKSIALKWKKNKVAQGYKIYRSLKKKKGFRCVKTIKKASITRWKDTKVKSRKIYYYKLRAYRKVNGKTYYSKYTKILKVKAK